MQVKTVIELPEGAVEYTAFLKPEEVKFLLEYAVNDLILKGLMPFSVVKKGELHNYLPMPEDVQ